MSSWHTYPKIWSMGHSAIKELFFEEVLIEEKIDGSQFSFGIIDDELKFKSKNCDVLIGNEGMFKEAVDYVISVKHRLRPGWTYRAEYLMKPKHNVLAYDRAPTNNLILFDVNDEEESYINPEAKKLIAEGLGLECVPVLFYGKISSVHDLMNLLDKISVLGGQKIEGFVCKNYARFGKDKKALMGKFVSESFKEKHKKDWKEGNPGQNDIIQSIINEYRTSARWDKAIIHLQEKEELENSPRDIGKLMKEIPEDILSEYKEEIKDRLFNWAIKDIMRGCNKGLAEYYKEYLMKRQFEK